jgi:hypothetical protein
VSAGAVPTRVAEVLATGAVRAADAAAAVTNGEMLGSATSDEAPAVLTVRVIKRGNLLARSLASSLVVSTSTGYLWYAASATASGSAFRSCSKSGCSGSEVLQYPVLWRPGLMRPSLDVYACPV